MDNKLKILMLTDDFEPIYGGVTSVVKGSSIALSKFADVTIGTVMPPKKLRDKISDNPAYKVVRCKGKYNNLTTNMSANLSDKAFKQQIEGEKYDIIHCHFPLKLYKYALKLRKKYNVPVVITVHSIFYTDFKNILKLKCLTNLAIKVILKTYNRSNKTFCVTKYSQDFLKKYGLKNCQVLYNAVNMDNFTPMDQSYLKHIKQTCNIAEHDFVIVSVGRLVKVKNLYFSIRAFAQLHQKFKNTKYIIVGDGNEYSSLNKLIEKLNLQDCCFLIGAVTEKQKLGAIYTLANLNSFMSIGDSCGLIQYESAFFETPTIALSGTAIAECIEDNVNGVVLNNSQSENLMFDEYVLKIGNLIANPFICKQLGQNAKQTVYRTYDEKYAKELIEIYKSVICDYKNTK